TLQYDSPVQNEERGAAVPGDAVIAPVGTLLDVRPVPPNHRYDTSMVAYEALLPGGVLKLVVDHDPKCMYYTLRATQGEDAFRFEYLERGPEVWRVRVEKTAETE